MKATLHTAGLGAFLGSLLWLTTASNAASIVGQGPCTSGPAGSCILFDFDDTIPTVRKFTFSLTSAGTVQLTFHGSLFCGDTGFGGLDKVVDLVSQIVIGNDEPSLSGPGSLRHTVVLKDSDDHAFSSSDSFSLASTRVINYSSGGTKTVRFKIARARMDPNINCLVYNAAFSAVITP